jgi:hypothetical protein
MRFTVWKIRFRGLDSRGLVLDLGYGVKGCIFRVCGFEV